VLALLAHRPSKIRNGVEAKWPSARFATGGACALGRQHAGAYATPPDHHAAIWRRARRGEAVSVIARGLFISMLAAVTACSAPGGPLLPAPPMPRRRKQKVDMLMARPAAVAEQRDG